MLMRLPATQEQPLPLTVRLKFNVLRAALWLVLKSTSPSGLYALGKAFAMCEWIVNYKRRRRFHERMRVIFGPQYDRRRMRQACRRYFVRTRCDKIFYLMFDLFSDQQIKKRICFPGKPRFDASMARGKGVYVAMSHFGAQHIAGLLMCFMGYPAAGVRDRNEGPLRRYIQQRLIRRFGELKAAHFFFADAFPRDIYRWLQDGGLMGSALDAEHVKQPHVKRMQVKVFGETKEYVTGTMQIAIRCQAAIHQGFIISRPNFYYEMHSTPPLIDPKTAKDQPEDLQSIMQRYAGNIEEQLRLHPDHVSRI